MLRQNRRALGNKQRVWIVEVAEAVFCVLMFVLTGAIMVGRIMVGAHYLSDVVGSVLLALVFTGPSSLLEPGAKEKE